MNIENQGNIAKVGRLFYGLTVCFIFMGPHENRKPGQYSQSWKTILLEFLSASLSGYRVKIENQGNIAKDGRLLEFLCTSISGYHMNIENQGNIAEVGRLF